jgi:enoyl-CoA hydratase/carnithine racemase
MPDVHIRLRNDFLWLILNRPPLNKLTVSMVDECAAALEQAHQHPPRLLVITGTGEQAFCGGIEMSESQKVQKMLDEPGMLNTQLAQAAKRCEKALAELRSLQVPTVALVKGQAFDAGCELAALCDTIIAHEQATFRLPTPARSLFPSARSTCLPVAIGKTTMDKLSKNEQVLSAWEAFHLGLVHQVLPARRFLLDAEELLLMLSLCPFPSIGESA